MSDLPQWTAGFCAAIEREYRAVRLLGQGGMASVLLAEERSLKRLVAIKVLDPHLAEDKGYQARFAREAEAAARLQHPNIVPIYRVGEAAGLPFYAMQYVEGETLAARVARDGRLDADTATRLTREVALALGTAHRHGVVHRDVKPHNILLEAESGRAVVTDFGIARLMHDNPASATLTSDQLTGLGRLIGTPRYMSPEQATGGTVGPASDLYSLGVVLYEMLSGSFPYDETAERNPMFAHVASAVVPLTSRTPTVPPHLATVTERLLEKDPARRYTSAEQLVTALDGARVEPVTARTLPRRRGVWLGGAVVSGLVVTAALLALKARAASADEDPRRSLLVGYFDNTARDPALEWLRIGGVELLARSLSRWSDLRVVETSRLLDLARKAKIAEGASMSHDDVLRLAREAGVGTAGVGSILRTGTDRSSITLRLYDVRSDSMLIEATEEVASDSLVQGAFARLADRVFNIAGAPQSALLDAEPPTRSLVAWREYVAALRASNNWRLDSAELHLKAALEADPRFAMAWLRRAITDIQRFGGARDSLTFERYADSAFKYASGRPVKERLLIEAGHSALKASYGEARATLRRLIALDSLNADAWMFFGISSIADGYVVQDAAGRDSTGLDPTVAFRAFRKAVALDGSNHQPLAALGGLLSEAALESPGVPVGLVTLWRGRPKAMNHIPGPGVNYRLLMVSPDSFVVGPAATMNRQYTATHFARSRTLAMGALRETVDQWLTVGPDEGQAHFLRSRIAEFEGDYDVAVAAFDRAVSLGGWTPPYSPDWDRLQLAMVAKRDSVAVNVSTKLQADFRKEIVALERSTWFIQILANAQVLAGRLNDALVTRAVGDSLRRMQGPRTGTMLALRDSVDNIRNRAWSGWMTAEDVSVTEQRLDAMIESLPDSMRASARRLRLGPLGLAAATLGDTGRLAKLRSGLLPALRNTYPGLSALAAALAGDRAGAAQWLDRAASDTSFPWPGSRFTAGQAAQLIGRPADALRFFTSVDSASLNANGTFDHDWILFARSIKGRGDAALALGDTAAARRHYERFVRLWKDADKQFQPEREAAIAALASLKRGDRPQVRVIPR